MNGKTFRGRVEQFMRGVLCVVMFVALILLVIVAVVAIPVVIGGGLAFFWGVMLNAFDFVSDFVRAGGLF